MLPPVKCVHKIPDYSIGRSKRMLERHSHFCASFQTAVQQLGVNTTTAARVWSRVPISVMLPDAFVNVHASVGVW